jgi:hypothetical protein
VTTNLRDPSLTHVVMCGSKDYDHGRVRLIRSLLLARGGRTQLMHAGCAGHLDGLSATSSAVSVLSIARAIFGHMARR